MLSVHAVFFRGIEPNVVTYGAVISVNSKLGYFGKVTEILTEMKDRNVEPNLIIYNSAIDSCIKGSNNFPRMIHETVEFCFRATETWIAVVEGTKGPKP